VGGTQNQELNTQNSLCRGLEEGVVDGIEVLESPDDRLSKAAVEAIKECRFEPALCDGEPAAVYYNLTVNFRLE
jgi:TonB family protein